MNQIEKCELLKDTIEKLYSKEGRSRIYISNLLGLNRKILGKKILEWDLELPKNKRYIKPSTQKFLNKNKQFIKSKLDNNISISKIANLLGCDRRFLTNCIDLDDVLKKSKEDYLNRINIKAIERKESYKKKSKLDYYFEDLENEEWKEILGFEGYYVSNMGRVKHYIKSYDCFSLLKPSKNSGNGRLYICLNKDGIRKNFILARLVGHSFCEGFSNENNTINHKDGNIENNCASNLEWVSQSDNNKHSYDKLKRPKNVSKPLDYYILYKDTYRFKTISSFAKFINKSWTQAKRYLEEPEKYDIKLIQK